jgi:GntR family transcriptional regulator
MQVTVDPRSPVSLDDQIRGQLRELIATGALKEGQPLPSVRQLAADLEVHFNTVARAYRRLEDEGLLAIGHGRGVFVKPAKARPAQPVRQAKETVAGRLRQVLVDARLLGLSAIQMRELVLEELEAFARKGKRA